MPLYTDIDLHPSSHPPSALKTDTYNVICIGSGWAGRIIAARIVKAGLTAIVIENELVGALEEAKAVTGVKEKIAEGGVLVDEVFKRRDQYTGGFDDGAVLVPMVESRRVHTILTIRLERCGLIREIVELLSYEVRGRIVDEKLVQVETVSGDSVTLHATYAVAICTGSEPIIPDHMKAAKPWTPRNATSSSIVPKHLVIVGAGSVGTEMATAYSGFGAKVTLVCSTEEILPKFDSDGGKIVRERLITKGVDVHLSTTIVAATREADSTVKITLSNGDIIAASELLVAVGRRAQTANVGLEKLGLKGDGSPIPVDDSLRVNSVPGHWLYAAGDVNGRATLTHSSKYHGRIVANSILGNIGKLPEGRGPWGTMSATADILAQPAVVFTDPAIASVGLTRKAAKRAGIKFREIIAPVQTLGAKLRTEGYEPGWAQWIVDEESRKLLGATFVGSGVADLLHASTVAVVGGLTLEQLSHAIPSFPTMTEVYLNLLDAAGL